MGKINVLDSHVAELIAAGEVVERPASVVKEMVENAIDAGATVVTVEIKQGGVSYIRITDNGCGMEREDVPMAFLRHATSKVSGQEDLEAIGTLGFRGEALASIAAVARVEVMTRPPKEPVGTRYVIEGGEVRLLDDAGCPVGTTFVIRDLFFNTPARMKFLKKNVTEANAVSGVVDKIALSHPEVSIRFIRDGKQILHTPGNQNLLDAVYAVFGREFTDGLIPVDYEYGHVRVWGYISRPASCRPNRSMQNFFINGRFIKSRTAAAALDEAFKGSIMVGKFPACVLHLQMSFQAVDVNVHPAKLEVRFVNEKPVFDVVYHGVKTALQKEDTPKEIKLQNPDLLRPPKKELRGEQLPLPVKGNEPFFRAPAGRQGGQIPSREGHPKMPDEAKIVPAAKKPAMPVEEEFAGEKVADSVCETYEFAQEKNPREDSILPAREKDAQQPVLAEKEPAPLAEPVPIMKPQTSRQAGKPVEEPQKPLLDEKTVLEEVLEEETVPEKQEPPARVLGEAFGTYVILQRGEKLVLVDKHAAHERLLYEKLRREGGGTCAQMLLEPATVTLDKNEYAAVLEARDLFAKAGFEVDDFGSGTVAVRSAPLSLDKEDAASAVMEMAGYLTSSRRDLTTEHLDWLYHNIACRAAVKAGDFSSPRELAALVEQLEKNPDVRYCPHGRPVSVVITRRELEKQFGRA